VPVTRFERFEIGGLGVMGTEHPLKQTSPGGEFKRVRALLGKTVPVRKAEIPPTAAVARMLKVPILTATVIGAACVPTTPLKACSVEFAPAVTLVPEPTALSTEPPLAMTFTDPPVLSDPSVASVPAI